MKRSRFAPIVALILTTMFAGCGPSKEEERIRNELSLVQKELSASQEMAASAQKETAVVKATNETLKSSLVASASNLKIAKAEIARLTAENAEQKERLNSLVSEVALNRANQQLLQEKLRQSSAIKADSSRRLVTQIRILHGKIEEDVDQEALKSSYAEAKAALRDLVANGEMSSDSVGASFERALDGTNDILSLRRDAKSAHEYYNRYPLSAGLVKIKFLRDYVWVPSDRIWPLVNKWHYPQELVEMVEAVTVPPESLPSYRSVKNDKMIAWILDSSKAELKKIESELRRTQ